MLFKINLFKIYFKIYLKYTDLITHLLGCSSGLDRHGKEGTKETVSEIKRDLEKGERKNNLLSFQIKRQWSLNNFRRIWLKQALIFHSV